jgi:hypothetical protein
MAGAEERRKLMKQFENEPLYWLGAMLKCAAGLVVLVVIAAGPWALLSVGGPVAGNEAKPAPLTEVAIAETRHSFD